MTVSVQLDDQLVADACNQGQLKNRSREDQLELWIRVGRAALDNPDLPASFIADALIAKSESRADLETFKPLSDGC